MGRGNVRRSGNNKRTNKGFTQRRNHSKNNKNSKKKRNSSHFTEEHNQETKKIKVDIPKEIVESSSESENENEVAYKKLLSTLSKNSGFLNNAVESTDESEEELSNDEEVENDNSDSSEAENNSDLNEDQEDNTDCDDDKNIDEVNSGEAEIANEETIDDKEIDHETEMEESSESIEDPFSKHFLFQLSENLLDSLQTNSNVETKTCTWNNLGTFAVQIPKPTEKKSSAKAILLKDDTVYAEQGAMPQLINLRKQKLTDIHIKPQIADNIETANKKNRDENMSELPLTNLQSEMFSIINNYQDLYYPERTFKNGEEIRFVYSLHAINHVLKTRTKILHHNARLSKKTDVPDEYRDQGLVRPKVLIVVPFKDSAYRIINMFINILVPEEKGQVINKTRFVGDFTGSELALPKKNPRPEDYEQLFSGNTDDTFRIGMSITKKTLKLYTDFYSSDIIVASPLGLRMVVGAQGEAERDYDFLASIEVLILDQTEQFLMQNWDHFLHVLDHLHMQPKESHGTDFARVRMWSIDGLAKYYRQTLMFSTYNTPEMNALFNRRCFNYAGKAKIVNPIVAGSICQVFIQIPHIFHKINVAGVKESVDARFEFFVNKILPDYKDTIMKHTLIYIPSYFDFIKLRNYFKNEDLSFVQICEYSKDSRIARARDLFFHSEAHFLLYSERFHHFRRIRLKGIRHIIFYQPATVPHFYPEIVNFMVEANQNRKAGNKSNMSVSVLYCKYDVQYLASIVGTERATKMIQSERSTHMFTTGE